VDPAPIEHAERHGTTGSLDDALRARLESALRETGGNIRRTAVLLGISRNTLRARMATYGLVRHGPLPGAQRPPAASAAGLRPQWERRHLRSCASHSGRHRPTIRNRTQHHSLGPVVGLLLAHTEGNPLFLEKHVRSLRETGVLVGERGASRLLASVATVETAPTVQASRASRSAARTHCHLPPGPPPPLYIGLPSLRARRRRQSRACACRPRHGKSRSAARSTWQATSRTSALGRVPMLSSSQRPTEGEGHERPYNRSETPRWCPRLRRSG
jgi:hypothetical protein